MNRCLQKVVIHILFFIVASASGVYALPDSTSLPVSLINKLNTFRQKDELDYWIYERIMYTEKAPADRINFLMRSQQEAWRSYKTYYERMAWLDLLSVQGYYQLQTGNIIASINAYETALEFYESYPLPDADIIETVLKPLGNNYTRLADYSTALFIHQKIMALAQKANNRNLIASTYSNMAICSRSQDDLVTATGFCREGIRYAEPQTALYGLLLSTRADILTAQLKYDSAEAFCNLALKKLQPHQHEASTVYWYANALQVAAKLALEKKHYNKAVAWAKQALHIFQRYFPTTKQREKAKVYILLGDITLRNKQAKQSLTHYQQALLLMMPAWQPATLYEVPPPEYLYSENTLTDALCGKAASFIQLQSPQEALQHYITAFDATGRLRKEFFYTESKLKEITENRARVEAAIKLAYNLWQKTANKNYLQQLVLISEMSRAQVLQDERQARLKTTGHSPNDSLLRRSKQLQQAIQYYQHELLSPQTSKQAYFLLRQAEYDLSLLNKKTKHLTTNDSRFISRHSDTLLSAITRFIPNKVTMLQFVDCKDSSFIIELNNQGIQKIQVINAGNTLHNTIAKFMQRWFAAGPSAMMNEPRSFYIECHNIYKTIFKDYVWEKDRHYVLIPDGMFNYLPFDALITDPVYKNNFGQWPYLIKQASFSQAYSLATWLNQQTAQYPTTFTGFFVSKGEHTKQVALSIDEEYQALSNKITGNYYSNATATWNTFNNISDSTGILHISTHGVSSVADAAPYLQLYDKPFYLFDLRYRNFAPALVVLSACKTADGQLVEGEGLNSLSRGFTAAGAGGVISGLWNMNDKTAIALMQEFYNQLSQQPNIALALHHARLQWVQEDKENSMLQLPYYWAGYVYSGHLQKLTIPVVQTNKKYYWLLALLILPAVLFVVNRKRKKFKRSPVSAPITL
jgi:CHAT domain-containing protein